MRITLAAISLIIVVIRPRSLQLSEFRVRGAFSVSQDLGIKSKTIPTGKDM